jgi:hypothetical protein
MMLGGSADSALITGRSWVFPMLGLAVHGAAFSSPRVIGSVDGSIVEQRSWTAFDVDGLLPGVGYRWTERRWMFGATIRTGVSGAELIASVASGRQTVDHELVKVSFLLRAELEGCRRIDPVERVCLSVAPTIYQFGFGNGGVVGLRWEVGP